MPDTPEFHYLSSGNRGLDRILGGHGFLVRSDSSYPSILIAGEPGCGKSTLGLTIGLESLKPSRNGSSLVVSLEESPNDCRFLAEMYGLLPEVVTIIHDGLPDNSLEGFQFPDKAPLVCFSYYPDLSRKTLAEIQNESDISSLVEFVHQRIDRLQSYTELQGIPRLQSVVIDSLPIFPTDSGDYAAQRALFKSLCEIGTAQQLLMILVIESNRQLDWREFVTDIVLTMGWEHDEVAGDVRWLWPVKTRYQQSWDGRHYFRIRPESGIKLFPRSLSVIRNAVESASNQPAPQVRFSSDRDFNRFLLGSDEETPILAGSMTLLFGEDETRKNVVATRFLQGAFSEKPHCRMVFIAAGVGKATAEEIIRRYWLNESTPDICPGDVEIMEGPGVFEHVDEFIARVEELFDAKTLPVTRVLVDDEAAFFRNGYFSHPLREFLRARQITTLFVRTVDRGNNDANREHFDNVIYSRHLVLPTGESRVGYRVMKLRGAALSMFRSRELRMKSTNAPLQMADSFKFYREGTDNTLATIPWHLRLYYPSDDQQEFWQHNVKGLFASVYAGDDGPKAQPFDRLEADSVFQAIVDVPIDYPLMGTEIVNVDDYWGESLAANDRLVTLDEVFEPKPLADLKSLFLPEAWKNAPKDRATGKMVGVPHHIDFGIYVVRTDILDEYGITLSDFLVRDEQNRNRLTWDSMCEICDLIRTNPIDRTTEIQAAIEAFEFQGALPPSTAAPRLAIPQPDQIRFFDGTANGIDESFVCLVLEVIWPFVDEWQAEKDSLRGSAVFNTPKVRAALKKFHSVLDRMAALPLSTSTRLPSTVNATDIALFQRHWFVSYWWQQRRCNYDLKDKFAILDPPLLDIGGDSKPAVSIRGDWFLGVVKGSPDLSRAASAIRTMTSETAGRQLHREQIGVPTLASLLSAGRFEALDVDCFLKLYRDTKSRGEIPPYNRIRTCMMLNFRDIFSCKPVLTGDELDKRITQATAAIDDELRRIHDKEP